MTRAFKWSHSSMLLLHYLGMMTDGIAALCRSGTRGTDHCNALHFRQGGS